LRAVSFSSWRVAGSAYNKLVYVMSLTEVIPIIESLPHPDKFKLMQFLLIQLAQEENIPLQMPQQNSLWDIIGMAEGEQKNIAQQHDKYLYSVK